jgi:hypothetical protein
MSLHVLRILVQVVIVLNTNLLKMWIAEIATGPLNAKNIERHFKFYFPLSVGADCLLELPIGYSNPQNSATLIFEKE